MVAEYTPLNRVPVYYPIQSYQQHSPWAFLRKNDGEVYLPVPPRRLQVPTLPLLFVAALLVYVTSVVIQQHQVYTQHKIELSSPSFSFNSAPTHQNLRYTNDFVKNQVVYNDSVTYIPDFGTPLEIQYAGLLTIDGQNGSRGDLFYWFFHCRNASMLEGKNIDNIPLLIWLNSGPGESSLFTLFTSIGPYKMSESGAIEPHPQAWNLLGHLLFLDQPVGVGYSSAQNDSVYANNENDVAGQLYQSLQKFYHLHPQYIKNPVYICGESYAGKYIPSFASYIHHQSVGDAPLSILAHDTTSTRINLHGIVIGNGMMWPVLQTQSVPDFAIALGLIDIQEYEMANSDISICESYHRQGFDVEAFRVCRSVEDKLYQSAGKPFIYDVRKSHNDYEQMAKVLSAYLNRGDVQSELNILQKRQWSSIDSSSFESSATAPPIVRHLLMDEMLDVPVDVFRDLLDNYQVLFYAGNMDGSSCNNLGIGRTIDRLAWSGTNNYRNAPRKPWLVNGKLAGLVKSSGNMSYVVVLNSGHPVPREHPIEALDMMTRFLSNTSFFSVS